ncbi:hypothetical protein FFLO_00383 [Filobasidium floriforme]|uniref:Adhesion regulating molecule n=1 Tax=Filobasidium floriforme TaxID=5210 RepID=A0A8K0JSH6_9TREE|nr:proteasome complex subunit Rpn13 ubiquitin receptor-domain-containing protein [Filobasidium floriforme]KAG7575393.1 hypothetical protein FFLO_00383 [Filobasidium floriforme]KAH8089515.1 proteasome complex subunit Rpn13 ubiquitin receptor-domain-containing protein [Filobasidium floriforme]
MAIISIKAGRCKRRGETNWVDPQPAKGRIEIQEADGLLTFYWKSREGGSMAEDDELIIFPGDCTFEKVDSDLSGRTHVLKFSSSDSRDFFWFQEASTSRDETDAFNINSLLQDPNFAPIPYLDDPAPDAGLAKAAGSAMSALPPQTPAHSLTTSSNPVMPEAPRPQRIADFQGRASDTVPATPGPSGTAATAASAQPDQPFSQEQISALARMLQQSVQNAGAEQVHEDAHLTDILTPANLIPILTSSPNFIHSLIPHLPSDLPLSSPPTQSEIQSIIASAQWSEAVSGFDAALRTGALTGTMGSLGMSERAGRGVGEFLEEVIRKGKEDDDAAGQGGDKMDTD